MVTVRFFFCCIFMAWLSDIHCQSDHVNRDRIRSIFDVSRDVHIFREILRDKEMKASLEDLNLVNQIGVFSSVPFDSRTAWEFYTRFAKAYSILSGDNIQQNGYFNQGYFIGELQEDLADELIHALDKAKTIPIVVEDYEDFYGHNAFSGDFEKYLNEHYTYCMLDKQLNEVLNSVITSLKKPIEECLGSRWEVVNVRAWRTPPNTFNAAGGWHTDGFLHQAIKIMIYPLGANPTIGSIALILNGKEEILHLNKGGWVLFKNSEITHRAVPPQPGMGDRPAIELTIAPSICFDSTPVSAGLNAHHPMYPWLKPKGFYYPLDRRIEIEGINLGGGKGWSTPGWINLELQSSASNPYGFKLTPNCQFPALELSVKTIYTSHNLEHLNLPTVYRILVESHRVLQSGGDLVIKIPDYDRILDSWIKNDTAYFDDNWNFGSTVPTWRNKGLIDCIDHRASVILCSYFNKAHGDQFSSHCTPGAPGAYLGPAVMTVPELRQLLQENPTPSQIASKLREHIKSQSPDWEDFCHQSAWSRQELKALLESFGFEVISFDINTVISTFKDRIYDIENMASISTYCWARKKN